MDAFFYGKPVEFTEDRGDVFSGGGAGEQAGSRVLDILQFLKGSGGEAVQDAIAIVESGGDKSMD